MRLTLIRVVRQKENEMKPNEILYQHVDKHLLIRGVKWLDKRPMIRTIKILLHISLERSLSTFLGPMSFLSTFETFGSLFRRRRCWTRVELRLFLPLLSLVGWSLYPPVSTAEFLLRYVDSYEIFTDQPKRDIWDNVWK